MGKILLNISEKRRKCCLHLRHLRISVSSVSGHGTILLSAQKVCEKWQNKRKRMQCYFMYFAYWYNSMVHIPHFSLFKFTLTRRRLRMLFNLSYELLDLNEFDIDPVLVYT